MESRPRNDEFGDDRWKDLHEWFDGEAKEKEADVVFLGDDHIALLEQSLVIVVSVGNCDVTLSKDDMLDGLRKVAELVKQSKPNCKIFFLKLLPSGRRPNKRREFVSEVNSCLESVLSGTAEVIDVEPSIQGTNGEIEAYDMFDFVHLTQEGYRKIFDPVYIAVSATLNPEA